MNLIESAIMGLVQGLTEFLPVSSSGHMVLAKALLGVSTPGALWETALHLGTLFAVVAVFRRELWDVVAGFFSGLAEARRGSGLKSVWRERENFRLAFYLILGTVPAAIAGLAFSRTIEELFSRPLVCALMLFITGEILWLSRPCSQMRHEAKVGLADSLWIGIAQAGALIPGISRSGATISAGLVRGVSRDAAARFSFLLVVPAILGACVLEARKIEALTSQDATPLLVGVGVATVTGYITLRLLLRVVRAGKLHWFAYYCWAASIASATWLWSGIQAPR